MCTRSSSNLPVDSSPNPTTSNPKRRNRRRSKQPFNLEESPVDTMADQRTMAELLRAPTKGYAEAIVNALNPADQDSLNSAAGGNLLERRTQDVLTIIENKSKVHNSLNKSIVSQVKSSDANSSSSSEIAKTYSCSQTANKCCDYRHDSYSQTIPSNPTSSFCKSRHLLSNTIANLKGEIKAITTRSGIVLDGPSVPIPLPFINPEEDERVEETLTDQDLAEYTIKVPPPLLHINITLADALIRIPKYQKMLKALLSNKEKLLELANTSLNENCSAVILKKLPEKLRDLGKFLILCGFSELKCKALADLANRAICTLAGIVRDVFISVGKFTFPADFFIVDYESDPRVPLILGRPFLQTARALIDVHEEEMILRDGDKRLTLNMRHDTSSYSKQPQKESINMINIYDDLSEDFLENLFATNHQSGNPTFSSHPNLTSPKVKDDVFNPEGGNVLIEKLIDLDSTEDLPPPYNVNPLIESDTEYVYDDPFDSKGEKIKESKLLINVLDLPRLSDFHPSPEYDSFLLDDFSEVDTLPLTNNKDKVFNPGILIQENLFEVITRVTPDKNVKKLAISHASLILEDFDPPLYELPFFKEVPGAETLLSFSFKNEEKVFKPGILTSKGVRSSLIPKLSHRGYKVFKIIKILESPMEIFLSSHGEDIRILDVPCLHFYPP
uniref:Reverse transcriptase domain-containing protein n=1 Tax=Tanacetum cinerariifolium TaxID=118510 RepID=A0A6L2MPJ5_TANCI|nr:hypothetical protein [Tanacetum cinerariifolium]